MAGSPRKRARKLGLPLPNAGDRPPQYPRARARAKVLPSDAQLEALAKRTLMQVMEAGEDDKDRVAAARAMLEARRRAGSPADELDKLSDEDLGRLAAQANDVMRAGQGETRQ
jgi:hypothetical protein